MQEPVNRLFCAGLLVMAAQAPGARTTATQAQTRRTVLIGGASLCASSAAAADRGSEALRTAVQIEADLGGRVGLFALGASGGFFGYRLQQRFPMCSTFKFLLAGAVLKRVDLGLEQLDRRISYTRADLLSYAPITKAHLAEGALAVSQLCEAAVTLSDNTAANLLLASIGGPAAVTAFARQIGDDVTRLDRNEPSLNTATPGDLRDTTTPRAVAEDMLALLAGRALSTDGRERLTGWLVGCKTGAARIRAGIPSNLRVGDKTGTGENGSVNDVAVIWPEVGGPVVISVYLTGSKAPTATLEAAISELARLSFLELSAKRRPSS